MNKRYEELYNKAIEMLDDSDDLFVDMVNELDSWDGFADGYRCYDMAELDEMVCGLSFSDALSKLSSDFDINDNYFYDSVWGIESTDFVEDVYRDNTDSESVLDALLDNIGGYFKPYYNDGEFEDIIDELINIDPDDPDDEDDLDDDNDDDCDYIEEV